MKRFLFYFVIVLLLIQLLRPTKNTNTNEAFKNISAEVDVPENIQGILKRSCNDCHSNDTNYLWYHNIAPISWVVASHVKDGKKHLNFDFWGKYNANQKAHIIEGLKETIETREMPLIGYLKLHPEAVISDEDNLELLEWIHSLENE